MIQLFGLARLGRDAELRSTSGGDSVASLSLAFNYGRKGDDGKKPTQWVDGSIWGKRAEALAPYLTKGSLVTVTIEDAHIETFKKSDGSEGTKLIGRVTARAGAPDRHPGRRPTAHC
ncbi:Single-stranded DNA-binding protein [Cupriavidus phytorum]|uniref:Single-stranded DNA-binding protein n=1 Tax=Cupriavidus taiwanensis TaxID=164546 RepID=A0A975XBS9_9BURK|nr:single-stranded DNA-binding protein [Cupriavidus taiwanensis]SOY65639.1 Single-stranded DNA-binding protein [Cupriavidus taiwanensis]